MKVDKYDNKGKKQSTKVEIADSVFGQKINESLLSQAVFVYRSNQRQNNAHVKERGEVRGGGKKPWKQKGTGRARHGSSRSPIWVGGGVTFGPRNTRNFKKRLTKKMKKNAIRSAFSSLAKENKIVVMEKPNMPEKRYSKQVADILKNIGAGRKVLFVQAEVDRNLVRGFKNMGSANILPVNELNTYTILNSNLVVLFSDSIELIEGFWGNNVNKIEPRTTVPAGRQGSGGKPKIEKIKKDASVSLNTKKTVTSASQSKKKKATSTSPSIKKAVKKSVKSKKRVTKKKATKTK